MYKYHVGEISQTFGVSLRMRILNLTWQLLQPQQGLMELRGLEKQMHWPVFKLGAATEKTTAPVCKS